MRKFLKYYKWIISVGLIASGLVAIYNLIVSKKPELKEKLEKLLPYTGYVGAGVLVCGLWGFVDGFILSKFYIHAGPLMKFAPVMTIAILLFPPLCVILGLLQGLPQIAEWTGKDLSKVEELSKKLAPLSVVFGIIGIVVGFLILVFLLLFPKVHF